ncbi:CoA transferase [Streptomyces ipomoeae]|uniref:CoA transferase n=1 Tax=Streptomyces ipomoeae TaxID=103232 RepID=UPI0035A735BB
MCPPGWCRAASATPTRASPRTRPSAPPTARSPWRSATTGSSPHWSPPSDAPDWPTTPASAATPTASPTAPNSARKLEEPLRTRTADHWAQVLPAAGVPAGPVNSLDEAFAHAERLGLQAVVDIAGVRQVAHPIHLSGSPAQYRLPPPRLGEHTDDLFGRGPDAEQNQEEKNA